MQKRASLNEKFNGLAAAIFTKQANASTAAKLKDALNTPIAGMLAGTGVTGGLGIRYINKLQGSVRGMQDELTTLINNTSKRQGAADSAIGDVSNYLRTGVEQVERKKALWGELVKLKGARNDLLNKRFLENKAASDPVLFPTTYAKEIDDLQSKINAIKDQIVGSYY
jgi:hypothetical protein